jgi:ankyrin repeat protein
MLHDRGVRADLPTAAGLGRLDLVRSFIGDDGRPVPGADEIWRRTTSGGVSADAGEAVAHAGDVLADALLSASVNGWPEVVSALLDLGAPVDRFRPWGPFLVTPLHGAAWAGWPETVGLLLARGADPSAVDPTYGTTPLGWARHCGRDDAVRAFQRAGVDR